MTSRIFDRLSTQVSLTSDSSDLSSVCQKQIEQIAYCLPCLATWMVYREQAGDERKSLRFFEKDKNAKKPELLSYLEGEKWLDRDFPELQWTQWELQGNPKPQLCEIDGQNDTLEREHLTPKTYVYIYCFAGQEKPDEYFLLWRENPLLTTEYHYLAQQINLLQNYMSLMQTVTQQQEEIEFLKQLIQRGKHQLREPLALIGLYAENLCLGLSEGHCQEQAKGIRNSVKELSHSLKRLLNSDREMKICPALYDLKKILQETLTILAFRLEQKNLQCIYPERGVILAVDRWQIKQLFEVLLCNAISFSPEGAKINCNWQVLANKVVVEVCDRGVGLSPEDIENVFSPFYSRRVGGTGLGLAIAKDIIDRHQGKIWGENLSEGGARFCFTLPREGAENTIGVLGEFCL